MIGVNIFLVCVWRSTFQPPDLVLPPSPRSSYLGLAHSGGALELQDNDLMRAARDAAGTPAAVSLWVQREDSCPLCKSAWILNQLYCLSRPHSISYSACDFQQHPEWLGLPTEGCEAVGAAALSIQLRLQHVGGCSNRNIFPIQIKHVESHKAQESTCPS